VASIIDKIGYLFSTFCLKVLVESPSIFEFNNNDILFGFLGNHSFNNFFLLYSYIIIEKIIFFSFYFYILQAFAQIINFIF